jgi:hypothetical protein
VPEQAGFGGRGRSPISTPLGGSFILSPPSLSSFYYFFLLFIISVIYVIFFSSYFDRFAS